MKVGDLISVRSLFTAHGSYEMKEVKIGMIVEGPNEVGKIRVLMSSGHKMWLHCNEVDLVPKDRRYLKQ